MAFNTSRSAVRVSRQAIRNYKNSSTNAIARPAASFSTSRARPSEHAAEVPRWSQTPERMKAPFSPHITKDPSRSIWEVNTDPQKLDDALNNLLGRDGERMLPDELKWLAVTHKSFDQGRRGFNDRLAFLGRQICALEATESIITSEANYTEQPKDTHASRRKPFEDPALRNLDNLTANQPKDMFSLAKLTKIAMDTGLSDVVRWKPRMPENIKGSGFQPVVSGAVYAVIGAIALQNGGKVASRVVRERIIKKLR
ncbi:ribonuclease-III-like-domain-containing protein [Xylariaceae sp. FL0016]|nr:ribonuclease-III-like-domain-containing protein [Xylariaceae sp. FL0016]